jgi:hypothetical protein
MTCVIDITASNTALTLTLGSSGMGLSLVTMSRTSMFEHNWIFCNRRWKEITIRAREESN